MDIETETTARRFHRQYAGLCTSPRYLRINVSEALEDIGSDAVTELIMSVNVLDFTLNNSGNEVYGLGI